MATQEPPGPLWFPAPRKGEGDMLEDVVTSPSRGEGRFCAPIASDRRAYRHHLRGDGILYESPAGRIWSPSSVERCPSFYFLNLTPPVPTAEFFILDSWGC